MLLNMSIFTLLFTVLSASAAGAMTCEDLIIQHRQNPASRADLQEFHRKALEKAGVGQEAAHNEFRKEVVALYDIEIQMLESRITQFHAAFKEEFKVTERWNYFSGVRLVVVSEIGNMERDIREMKRERQQVFRLIPRPNIFVRAGRAIRDGFRGGAENLSQSASEALNSQSTSGDRFLSPLNPASPYYNYLNEADVETYDGESDLDSVSGVRK